MFMKKKQFRKRIDTEDEDENEKKEEKQKTESNTNKPIIKSSLSSQTPKSEEKKKPSTVPGPSLLSFEGEEEEGHLAIKSKSKKKVGSGKIHELKNVKDDEKLNKSKLPLPSNIMPKSGEYSQEKLAELMKKTNRIGGSFKLAEPKPEPKSSEPVIILKGLIKPETSHPSMLQEKKTEAFIQTSQPVFDSVHGIASESKLPEPSKLTRSMHADDVEDADDVDNRFESTSQGIIHIPDSKSISLAKAKRERMRQAQLAPDYISLQTPGGRGEKDRVSSFGKEDGGEKGSSDEGEEDDEGRMVFVGLKKKDAGGKEKGREREERRGRQETKKGVEEMLPFDSKTQQRQQQFEEYKQEREEEEVERKEEEEEEDEEEENAKWEEEQLKKAFGKNVNVIFQEKRGNGEREILKQVNIMADMNDSITSSSLASAASSSSSFIKQKFETMSISIQGESVMKTLRDRLQKLRESHSRTKQEADKTKNQLLDSAESVLSLEAKIEECNKRYIYVQQFKQYIALLCDFLKEKAPLIEVLEEMMQKLCQESMEGRIEKRKMDEEEEWEEVEKEVFKIFHSKEKGDRKEKKEKGRFQREDGDEERIELDEFGRDLNFQKKMEAKRRKDEREKRRSRALSKSMHQKSEQDLVSEKSLNLVAPPGIEGESDSEASDSESKSFISKRNEIFKTADGIFSDASKEFSQLKIVKNKVEDFKKRYPNLYSNAYLSLSVPNLFSPYVRLQFVKWIPLLDKNPSFDNMDWYKVLFDFGLSNGASDSNLADADSDADIIPNLIDKIVLPNLTNSVQHCWDPLNLSSTQNCMAAIKEIMIYLPETNRNLLNLIDVVKSKLSQTIQSLQVASWPPAVLSKVASGPYVSARRFGKSLRLMRNIGSCSDVIDRSVLDEMVLKQLLCEKIIPHLKSLLPTVHDAVVRTERVIFALHRPWLSSALPSQSEGMFQPFLTYIDHLANAIEGRKKVIKEEGKETAMDEEVIGLARRVKKIYVALNEYDRARALSKTFGFREAL